MNNDTIKSLIPPLFLPTIDRFYRHLQKKGFFTSRRKDISTSCCSRPCHYHQLFVKSTGEVLPCCLMQGNPQMIIGHISDKNLIDKIKAFDVKCICPQFVLRKATDNDTLKIESLNLELSLACQATCAMCIVDAPSYRGVYDSYNDLTRIIQQLRPKEILAQGGEVLVQKKSIEFLSQIKEQFPSMNIDLVTNGCVDLDVVDVIDKLFSRITISFVGFERETYRKIMGLNLDKTITFVEEVKRRGKTKLHLKYLTTPLNFHETNLFLNWSLTLAPARVEISDADTFSYIYRATKDRFWDKILERTSKDVKFEILSFKAQLLLKQTILAISLKNRQMFDINDSFIAENELKSVILFNY